MKLILSIFQILFILSGSSSALACGNHDGTPKGVYAPKALLENCGGVIYPKCDDPNGINQKTIFDDSRLHAEASQRKLLVIFGADWCGPCKKLDKLWKDPANKDIVTEIEKNYLVVKIERTTKSAHALIEELGISMQGIPKAFVIDPVLLRSELSFFPSIYLGKNFPKIVSLLAGKKTILKPSDKYGSSSRELIEKEIGIVDGFGKTQWVVGEDAASKLVNQGAAMMHVFHYVDAYRSFLTAEAKDPGNLYAYIGQVFAGIKLSGKSGIYLASRAIEKAKQEVEVSSPADKAWFDFAMAFYKANSMEFREDPDNPIDSPFVALEKLKKVAPDSDEVLTLATYFVNPGISHSFFEVNQNNPEHVGAIHYLTHLFERTNQYEETAQYAKRMADLAPASAHAQHMYGHILPKLGKWKEAIDQFEKADQIHKDWGKKYEVSPAEDWHYRHNLDLMGVAYAMLGDYEKANSILSEEAENDSRIFKTYTGYLMATGQKNFASSMLVKASNKSTEWKKYLAAYRIKSQILTGEITTQNLKNYGSELSTSRGEKTLYALLMLITDPKASSVDVEEKSKNYIDALLKKKHGFDSWKGGIFKAIHVYQILNKVGKVESAKVIAQHLSQYTPLDLRTLPQTAKVSAQGLKYAPHDLITLPQTAQPDWSLFKFFWQK